MEEPSAMKRQTSGGARLRFRSGSKACTLCSYSGSRGEARIVLTAKLGSRPRETWPSRRCEDWSGQLSTRRETVRRRIWVSVPALVALLLLGTSTLSRADKKKDVATFGELEGLSLQDAQAKAQAWLKQVGKTDAQTQQKFAVIWNEKSDRCILDRVADTLALGDAAAAKLLADARNPKVIVPMEVPAALKDKKQPVFFRANLALAYAKALSNRRVFDEGLAALKMFQPEQVVDPASYLFHRAVAEHATLKKEAALNTIDRLLEEAVDAPERYKTIAALMLLDMQMWKEKKDLGAIARKMRVIEDRLAGAKGGPQTQKLQKEVIDRLDELIKELENKKKGGGSSSPGNPKGGQQPTNPALEPYIAGPDGKGIVDKLNIKKLDVEGWAKLPPAERTR